MRARAVLDTESDRSARTPSPARLSEADTSPQPVRLTAEGVQRPGGPLHRGRGVRTRRPFDAQYWACWIVAVVGPLVMAYLWVTR